MRPQARAGEKASHFPRTFWWEEAGEGRLVRELIRKPPAVVELRTSAAVARLLAANLCVNHLPVVDVGGEPVGMLCTCDLREVGDEKEVVDCMSAPPLTIEPSASLPDAAQMLCSLDIGALLVVEGSRLLGVVTRGDFRRAGLLSDLDFPRCGSCRGRHHVRIDPHSGAALCLICRDAGQRRPMTGA